YGLMAFSTSGACSIALNPTIAIVLNQTNIKGPNTLPTIDVPNRWIRNKKEIIAITIGTVGISGLKIASPSIAEEIVIAGVIIPSASRVEAPKIAGIISHFALRRTKEYKDSIPPSPLLSAFNVTKTYLIVV